MKLPEEFIEKFFKELLEKLQEDAVGAFGRILRKTLKPFPEKTFRRILEKEFLVDLLEEFPLKILELFQLEILKGFTMNS